MVATLDRRHELGCGREAFVERVTNVDVDAAQVGHADGEPVRIVVLKLDAQRAAVSHTRDAGMALSEDEYFGLPDSYLEYEWQ